jgi:hypothetical protein
VRGVGRGQRPCQRLPLPLISPATAIDPQPERTTQPAPYLDPAWQRASPATPRRPGRRRAHRGHPDRASPAPSASYPVTSPPASHQAQRSIPQASPTRNRPCMPPWTCRFDTSTTPRAPRALPHPPCAHTRSRPGCHTPVRSDQRPTEHHPRLAPTSPRLAPASPSSDPTGLKPSIVRPNPYATDTATLVLRTGARYRSSQPPTRPNRRRRRRTIERVHTCK